MTLEIVNRRAWGASHPDGFGNRSLPYAGFVLHHTAGRYKPVDAGFAREARHVRALEAVGQSRFGGGISYPWIVPASGRVFEGLSPHRRGAHTRGLNTSHSAISLPGNFDTNQLTPQQEEAIAQLMVREKRLGHAKHARILLGHRQAPGASTACPGRNGMAAISRINARAAALEAGEVLKEAAVSNRLVQIDSRGGTAYVPDPHTRSLVPLNARWQADAITGNDDWPSDAVIVSSADVKRAGWKVRRNSRITAQDVKAAVAGAAGGAGAVSAVAIIDELARRLG